MLWTKTLKGFAENIKSGKNALLAIAIQGCSTSGKSTIADIICHIFKKKGSYYKPFVFSTDCFFKSDPISEISFVNEPVKKVYDYDNPGALDWDLMFKSLNSFINQNDKIVYSSYDFRLCQRKDVEIDNSQKFNIIIAEGIFSHGLFTPKTYDYSKFEPTNPEKVVESEIIVNPHYDSVAKIEFLVPIFLDLPDEKIIENRIEIDETRTSRTSKKESESYTRKYVLKSTDKYVRKYKFEKSFKIYDPFNGNKLPIILTNFFKDLDIEVSVEDIKKAIDDKFKNFDTKK